MRLILLGPPGAGKGTQADVLCQRYKMAHISTGDLLRQAIKDKIPVGQKAKSFMDRGELVPDEIVAAIIEEKLKDKDTSASFILDGYPRTRRQAEILDKTLRQLEIVLDLVLYFETAENTILKRLTGRRVCRKCGFNYHLVNIPPKKENICDRCGGELFQRDDDRQETIKKRIEVYNQQTKELIDYYDKEKLLKKVSGDLDVEPLFKELEKIFRSAGLT
ncbi:MAG: adenylate kinase [Candidatus Omnitrophica bacterium]|nr:adenylate kinase [Candidatus Omnitrophota bacterium]